jgi:hypothetical protein
MRSIRKWYDEVDAKLQNCFANTDWNIFRHSSDGIEEFTTSVTGFINKCINDIIPTVTVCTYLNQKPWITGNIHIELTARAAAFKERDTNPDFYKKSLFTDEPSNRQSFNTGPRSNPPTPALTLVGCDRACKLSQITKGNPSRAVQ